MAMTGVTRWARHWTAAFLLNPSDRVNPLDMRLAAHDAKSRILRQGPLAAGLLLILVLAVSGWMAREYQTRLQWVEHTHAVRDKLGGLLNTLLDTESAKRGYLLTRNPELKASYETSMEAVSRKLVELQALTADNPEQKERLEAVKTGVAERFGILRDAVEAVEGGRPIDFELLAKGQKRMAELRLQMEEMKSAEDRLLLDRNDRSRRATLGLWMAAVAASLLSALVVLGWMHSQSVAQRELTQRNAELTRVMAEREAGEAKVRQLQKMEAVGQLTGGIAHDFNNMLAVVIGALGLAQKRLAKGDANIQQFIDGAMDGANRAASLTKRLLAFARQQPLAPRPIAANTLVSGMSELVSRTLGETVQMEAVLGAGLWSIHADPTMLENAVLNLCVNARDAMPDGGKLTIETANSYLDDAYARAHDEVTPGQYVMIAVSDTGTGMTPEVMSKVFDPFFSTKAPGKGTGLGLSQVHGFVKQSKGHIKIYSEPGTGTTIKMYFPRFNPPSGAAADVRSADVARNVAANTSGAVLVLIVEDDARVRETTLTMVTELGYKTIVASGAAEALRQLDANPDVALLFTDIVMPEINGRKLAEEAVRRRPKLKVLYTTGFTRNAVVHSGTIDPGVHLLQKPFTLEALAEKLEQALGDGDSGA